MPWSSPARRPAFCAGADLSHLGDKGSKEGLLAIYEGFMRVGRCPLPTIAAVNGAAVGAGMNLALVCDLRLAGASARFDTRFLNLGIHPGGGHTWMFQRIAGPQTTFATVVFGEVLDGAAAEKAGLVWRCVPDDELLPAAREMAGRALNVPVELIKKITATIREIPAIDDHREAMLKELEPAGVVDRAAALPGDAGRPAPEDQLPLTARSPAFIRRCTVHPRARTVINLQHPRCDPTFKLPSTDRR